MTLDDLMLVFDKAYLDNLGDNLTTISSDRAGVIEVVRALRDEYSTSGYTALNLFNEILGDAGEKAAGSSGVGSNPTPAADRFDFEAHLAHQAAWSEKTFGPGDRSQGIMDHIVKELCEVLRSKSERERQAEWVDVVILALDGAWRSGMSPRQIISGIVAKQAKNEARVWPDWRTADPNKAIEHDRSKDAADPKVCVWRMVGKTFANAGCEDEYLWSHEYKVCPSCGLPIKFQEQP